MPGGKAALHASVRISNVYIGVCEHRVAIRVQDRVK